MKFICCLLVAVAQARFLCPKQCECSLTAAVCSGLDFRSLRHEALEEGLEELFLNGTGFSEIPSILYQRLPSLKSIKLSGNQIVVCRAFSFDNVGGVEEISMENSNLNYVESFAFNNLPKLTKVSFAFSDFLFFLDPATFHDTPELETLDIRGTAIQYLELNFHPSNIIYSDEQTQCYLKCTCHNNWIEPTIPTCEGYEIAKKCEVPTPVIKEYDFDFDVTTVNEARCFFVGANNSEAAILKDDVDISTNGRYVPEVVDRSVDGSYTCALGEFFHLININVFASEDNLYQQSIEGKNANYTLAIADMIMDEAISEVLEVEYYYVDDSDDADNTTAAPGVAVASTGFQKFVNWFREHPGFSIPLLVLLVLLFLVCCVVMPRLGLYSVLFNLSEMPPSKE